MCSQNSLAILRVYVIAFILSFLASYTTAQNIPEPQVSTPPIANPSVQRPPGISNNYTGVPNRIKDEIKNKEPDYTRYMGVLKQHRDRVADMKVARRKSNARINLSNTSQNKKYTGQYDCDDTRLEVKPG